MCLAHTASDLAAGDPILCWPDRLTAMAYRFKFPTRRGRNRSGLRLRTPITVPRGRRLRVCSVARFSTEEQRRQSITAQHRFNRTTLESAGFTEFDWEVISDEGVSGELADRPGIKRLRHGIANREWDLILCEGQQSTISDVVACLQLVGLAADNHVRVICIGDDIDTAEEDWKDRLQEAQQHHCRGTTGSRAVESKDRLKISGRWVQPSASSPWPGSPVDKAGYR